MGAGRPTKYDPALCATAEKLAKLGLTDDEMAGVFDVTRETIASWKRKYPKFSYALKIGKELADANVAESLYRRATGYKHIAFKIFCNKDGVITTKRYVEHYPPDVVACIFWLKNRQQKNWRDKAEEVIGDLNEAAQELQRIAATSRETSTE